MRTYDFNSHEWRCACPDTDPVICRLMRNPEYRGDRQKVMELDDECQCPCHDWEEDDDPDETLY